MEVPSKEEYDKAIALILDELKSVRIELAYIKDQLPRWVDINEAMRLTGRSASWFRLKRNNFKLPIAYMPKTEGSNRLMYDREDCIKYGQKHTIQPPAHVH
jgi:hypothetical protein